MAGEAAHQIWAIVGNDSGIISTCHEQPSNPPSIDLRQRDATPGDPLVVARDRQAHSARDGGSVDVMTASSCSAGPDSATSRVSTAVLVSLCYGHAVVDTHAEILSAFSDDEQTALSSASAKRVFRI